MIRLMTIEEASQREKSALGEIAFRAAQWFSMQHVSSMKIIVRVNKRSRTVLSQGHVTEKKEEERKTITN